MQPMSTTLHFVHKPSKNSVMCTGRWWWLVLTTSGLVYHIKEANVCVELKIVEPSSQNKYIYPAPCTLYL